MAEKSDLSTAYHEAGHAVVGLVRDLDVYQLTIIRDESINAAGSVDVRNDYRSNALAHGEGAVLDDEERAYAYHWVEGRVLELLAGAIAHQMFTGEWHMEVAQDDMDKMSQEWVPQSYGPCPTLDEDDVPMYEPLLLIQGTDEEIVAQCWDRWGDECREILTANWAWVEAIAQAALDGDGNLTGEEMLALRC